MKGREEKNDLTHPLSQNPGYATVSISPEILKLITLIKPM